jgi:hypothetical protein
MTRCTVAAREHAQMQDRRMRGREVADQELVRDRALVGRGRIGDREADRRARGARVARPALEVQHREHVGLEELLRAALLLEIAWPSCVVLGVGCKIPGRGDPRIAIYRIVRQIARRSSRAITMRWISLVPS